MSRSGIDADFGLWVKDARALAKTHSSINFTDRETLRRTLVELHKLFLSSPGSVKKAYRAMADKRIVIQEKVCEKAISEGHVLWSLPGEEPEDIAALLGGLIRAIDATLGQYRSHWPSDSTRWLVDDLGWYVIPRDGPSRSRAAAQGQPYEKRGMLFHRMIPKKINGYSVEIFSSRSRHMSKHEAESWRVGACLFGAIELRPDIFEARGEKRFVILDAQCATAASVVNTQIENALNEQCVALVWPELTVPPALLKRLRTLLSDRDVEDARSPPEVVVAGSWHENIDGRTVNRSRIFDGYGVERFAYDKIEPYADGDWGREDIVPGTRVCVLATEAALIGFAICLDFCDVNSNPFTELDIDLILVPSMGNDRTIEGHRNTAAAVEVRFGTRTFVVQHNLSTDFEDGRLGVVIPMPKRPGNASTKDLGQNAIWKAYGWPKNA
ncbi:MAG: hypothetical protein WDN02_02915 [Methylovirgula sp.]|uniref:hypothetical protein n=1 Tax=Methylovirgula sp. TaxID=1978224 RepID=UPI00307645E2